MKLVPCSLVSLGFRRAGSCPLHLLQPPSSPQVTPPHASAEMSLPLLTLPRLGRSLLSTLGISFVFSYLALTSVVILSVSGWLFVHCWSSGPWAREGRALLLLSVVLRHLVHKCWINMDKRTPKIHNLREWKQQDSSWIGYSLDLISRI